MHSPLLERYVELLIARNETINLVGDRQAEDLRTRHLEDSLKLLNLPEVPRAKTLLDLGTGGGLPGIPIAISSPDMQVTMVDSTQKKIRAVKEFILELGLRNAVAIAGRAEEVAHHPEYRQMFDIVVARAFAKLPSLLEYAAPFSKIGGHVIAFKGPDPEEELNRVKPALPQLCCRFKRTEPYTVRAQSFNLLVFEVIGRIPKKFPRGQGKVIKKPLGG